jgi:WD40 repeat protein
MHMRSLGSIIGGLAAGPLGSLVGGLAGGLVGAASESLVPGASGVLANAFGASGAEALQSLGARLHANLPEDQRRRVNHDLQAAFRAAALEALYDLGGPVSFPERWTTPRDAPPPIPFAFNTYSQDTTALLANCLVQLEHAIQQQQVLPVAPPHDLAAASVYTYVEQTTLEALSADDTAARQTLAQLGDAFFAQAIAPWLDQEFPSLMVAAADPQDPRQRDELAAGQALREHLRTHLLERTLVHFNEQIKSPQHTEAWRAFNRLLLEELRASLATVGASQQQLADDQRALVQRLEVLIGQTDTEALSQFAGGMADLIATVGRTHQQTGEQLDGLLLRVSAQGDNLLALLTQNSAILAIVQDSALDISEVRRQVELLRDAFAVVKPGLERVAWVIPSQFQAEQSCPYPGLAVFDEQQAARFYGREDDVRAFLARPVRPVTVISGPSGVGKSSFVQAGLLPQLKQRSSTPLQTLVYRVSTSGELLSALAAFCAQQGAGDAAQLLAQFNQRDDALREVLRQIRPSPDGAVLLVLDQFEELFVGDDPARASDRRQLLDNLLQLERQPESWLSVILTSRENFFEHPDYLARERLRELVQAENVRLGGLSDQQLRAAITRPLENFAAQHGLQLRFEAGVVDLLLNDFRKTERTLPLVQYLLRLLWTEQHELSNAAYNRLGGIERALDRHASAIYERFNEREQRKVNAVLLALVRPGIANEYTRRRVRRDTLIGPDPAQRDHAAIVQQLAHPNSRLISEQQIADVAYLELTHEVLLRQWERLRLLIDMYKTRLQQREALLPNAEQWVQSLAQRGGRGDSAYLYRGNQLRQARSYVEAKELPEAVDHDIQRCYRASVQHQRRSLAFSGVAVVVVGLLIWLGFNFLTSDLQAGRAAAEQAAQTAAAERGLAEGQRAEAQQTAEVEATQRAIAEGEAVREARVARGRELVAAANQSAPDRAALLALEAIYLALDANEPVPTMSEQALRDALSKLGTGRWLRFNDEDNFGARYLSPDGSTLVTMGGNDTISVWDLQAPEPLVTKRMPCGETLPRGASERRYPVMQQLSRNRDLVIVSNGDDRIFVCDLSVADPNQAVRILRSSGEGKIPGALLSPDERTLISTSDGWNLQIWDLTAADPNLSVRRFSAEAFKADEAILGGFDINSAPILLSADGRLAITYTRTGFILIWDLTAADPAANVRSLRATPAGATRLPLIAIHPNSAILAVSSGTSLRLFGLTEADPATSEIELGGLSATINTLAFSPDGRWLSVGAEDGIVHLWDLLSADLISSYKVLYGHTGGLYSMTFRPDSQVLASSADDGIRLWLLPTPAVLSPDILSRLLPGGSGPMVFRPDGQTLLTESGRRVWDLNAPSYTPAMQFMLRDRRMDGPVLFSPDGRWLIGRVRDDRTIRRWDLHSPNPNNAGEILLANDPGGILGQSSDGSLLFTTKDGDPRFGQDASQAIYVWNLTSPQREVPRHILSGHTRTVTSLLLSPDEQTLFTADWEGKILVWDLGAADPSATVRVLHGHENSLHFNLTLSPDGRTLLSDQATYDEQEEGITLWRWDLQAADPNASARRLHDPSPMPKTTALSPDGRYFVTSSVYDAFLFMDESIITFWDLHADDPEATRYVLEGPEFGTDNILFLPDGQTLVAIGNLDGNVYFWDLSHPDPNRTLRLIPIPFSGPRSVVLAPDGKTLGFVGNPAGLEHPPLFLMDLTASDENVEILMLRTYEDTWNIVFSPDLRTTISGAFDHGNYATTVQGWALDVRELIAPACQAIGRNFYASEWRQYFGDTPYRKTCPDEPVPTEPFTSRTPTPEAEAAAALTPTAVQPALPSPPPDADPTAESEAATPLASSATALPAAPASIGTVTLRPRSFESEGAMITHLAIAPDGVAFAIQEDEGPLLLRRISDGTVLQRFEASNQAFLSLHFSPEGQYLAAGTLDGTIAIWRTSDGTLLTTLTDRQCPCAFAPDGQSLAAFAGGGSLTSWRISDGTTVQSFGGAIDPIQVKFAPDGQTITVALADDGMQIWRVRDGALLHTISFRTLGMDLLDYSPDSQMVAMFDRMGTASLWRVSDGSQIRRFDAIYDGGFSLAFAPDGQILASVSSETVDTHVKLWNVNDGSLVGELDLGREIEGGWITLRYSPDGRLLIIYGLGTKTVWLWEWQG